MQSPLSAVLDRARAAVLTRITDNAPRAEGAPPKEPGALPGAVGGVVEALKLPALVQLRPNTAPAPYVWLSVPAAPSQPSYAPLEALTAGHSLKPGPRRLFELLHSNTLEAVRARAYGAAPSQGTIHQPQELLARALCCHVTTIWRWTLILKAAGLVDAKGHCTTSRGTTRTDGTLYAVSLQPGHRAHLTFDDLSHEWRDLDADRQAGRTAWAALQEDLQGSDPKDSSEWITTLVAWAVTPGSLSSPVKPTDPCKNLNSVQDVVYLLPLLMDAHPTKRPALVGMLGAALARALNDQHSRRWYCRLIWDAHSTEWEGRGGLQHLAAQLARLDADRREWEGLRRPGALLAARLQTAKGAV